MVITISGKSHIWNLFGSVQKTYLKDLVQKTTDYTDTELTLKNTADAASVSVYEQETP